MPCIGRVRRGCFPIAASGLVLLILLSPTLFVSGGAAASVPSLSYAVLPNAYDNAVQVALSGVGPPQPRIVVGPDPANLSQEDVYVFGMSGTASCNASDPEITHLVMSRSTNGGQSFGPPTNTSVCSTGGVPASPVSAVVLPDGTLVVAVPGEIVRSTDGGMTWTVVLNLTGGPTYLTRDPVTGVLYFVVFYSNPESSPNGTCSTVSCWVIASSDDGGLTWSQIGSDPTNLSGLTSIAAWNNHLVVGGDALYYSGSSFTGGSAVASSSNGGATWSSSTNLTGPGLSCGGEPSVVVSPDGVFAAVCDGYANIGSDTNDTLVSLSWNGGLTWSVPVLVGTTGTSTSVYLSNWNTAVFDSQNRLFVTWSNYSADYTRGTLTVAGSSQGLSESNSTSFSTSFQTQTTAFQGSDISGPNLAADNVGRVWLTWYNGTSTNDSYDENESDHGLFVREIAGSVMGNVQRNASAPTLAATSSVTITLRSSTNGNLVRQANWTGQPFALYEVPPGSYQVWVEAGQNSTLAGTIPVISWGQTTLTIYLAGVAPGPIAGPRVGSGPSPVLWLVAGAAIAGLILLVAVFLLIPYVRLTREGVSQQKVRFVLYEYIQEHPGASFSAVRDAFGLRNGAAAYHLGVLEKQGFLRSSKGGYRRLYFPNGSPVAETLTPLSELQNSILETVRGEPGIAVREIGRRIGRDHSSVGYNVQALAREGLIRLDRVGLRLRCYSGDVRPSA